MASAPPLMCLINARLAIAGPGVERAYVDAALAMGARVKTGTSSPVRRAQSEPEASARTYRTPLRGRTSMRRATDLVRAWASHVEGC